MKRSEMIDEIMAVIDGDDSYPLARAILKKIEDLGMSPPSYQVPDDSIYGGCAVIEGWEPE